VNVAAAAIVGAGIICAPVGLGGWLTISVMMYCGPFGPLTTMIVGWPIAPGVIGNVAVTCCCVCIVAGTGIVVGVKFVGMICIICGPAAGV
jgi:hypothetical protein